MIYTEPIEPDILRAGILLYENRWSVVPAGHAAYFAFYVLKKTASRPKLEKIKPNLFER